MTSTEISETQFQFERASFGAYRTHLKDKYRPPSKGGNTRAWHQHVIATDGISYAFLALGAKKWAFAKDQVSFKWAWDSSRKYRNIDADSVEVWNSKGVLVIRGDRSQKPWRTAETRLPVRRKEWKD